MSIATDGAGGGLVRARTIRAGMHGFTEQPARCEALLEVRRRHVPTPSELGDRSAVAAGG